MRLPSHPRLLALLAVGLALGACGRGGDTEAGDGGSPVGHWEYAPELLAAALEERHADEGPAVVAQQKDLAHESRLEIEIWADGAYRMAVDSVGTKQQTTGHWKQDGTRLLFTQRKVDGETVAGASVEKARFTGGRIEIDFDGKVFTLLRVPPVRR
jgi:hypothetical protein